MHCPWTRKTRAWGYDVVRGIDEDDPLRIIRAFRHPTELTFVDLNAQVEQDYGGYAWTQWMHEFFGDTALHIALKWRRHRAVKALLSLRPNWSIPNEAGATAEDLVLQLYGKDMTMLKDEQEREYENDAMRAEDERMKSIIAEEHETRERARLLFLQKLQTERTCGIEHEAAVLLESGRILAEESAEDSRCAVLPRGIAASRWAAHICHELRRNRFAAQRLAMRRNVVPVRAPPVLAAPLPPPSPARSNWTKPLRPPTSASLGASRDRDERSAKPRRPQCGAIREEEDGTGVLFDGSAVNAGRRVRVATSNSPPRQRLRSSRRGEDGGTEVGDKATPTSPGGLSTWSGSVWSGRSGASPTRFDRSSRMSDKRSTQILAAGKSMQRATPMDRLQRKMVSRTARPRSAEATTTTATAALVRPPSPLEPAIVVRNVELPQKNRPQETRQLDVLGGGVSRDGEGIRKQAGTTGGIGGTRSVGKGKESAEGLLSASSSPERSMKRSHGYRPCLRPSTVRDVLRGVQKGPLKEALRGLLTSTVINEDGERVSAPSFPCISALRELKYSGPIMHSQASVAAEVFAIRPGVLVRLSLAGKRLGDEGAKRLAPVLPTIRIVDLRSCNIGDTGTIAIASALHTAAGRAATALPGSLEEENAGVGAENSRHCCVVESLSLAGNRVGDAGGEALSEMMEWGGGGNVAEGDTQKRIRSLRLLSVAGNPSMSESMRNRLLRAGSTKHRHPRSGKESRPPTIAVIV